MSADIYLIASGCCSAHGHNITHNVAPMLRAAGLDWHEYRDNERTGADLRDDVLHALTELADYPEKYRPLSAPNGWGTYEQVIPFLARLFLDCVKHPDARVEVSL